MKTFYVDVYFLINFTVDVLSVYFATLFAKVPTSIHRIVISSLLGALAAVGIVFLPEFAVLKLLTSALSLLIISLIAVKRVKFFRRIKFTVAFLIFEALVGGGVYFLWNILDTYLYDRLSSIPSGSVNRKMLVWAIIVLLSIGVFKMIVSFFSSNSSGGSVELEINLPGKSLRTEAFVDSGNLAVDPMSMRPVVFLKTDIARRIIPLSVIELINPDEIDADMRRRIRLIPISRGGETHVMTGVCPESVNIVRGDEREEICVTLVIDKEGGSYGGYGALVPGSVIENVR